MGIFESLRDAMRPGEDPRPAGDDGGPKHLAEDAPSEVAPSEVVDDPGDTEQPSGGKHARRD